MHVCACRVFVEPSARSLLASRPHVRGAIALVPFAREISLGVVAPGDLLPALIRLLVGLRFPMLHGLGVCIGRDASFRWLLVIFFYLDGHLGFIGALSGS